jgi:cell division protein FtsB
LFGAAFTRRDSTGPAGVGSPTFLERVRRAAGPARRVNAPRVQGRRSGRVAVLGLLLVAFVLTYAYPVRVYLGQQAQIAQMERDQAAQRGHLVDLQAQIDRWNDPEYVIEQARDRLQLVRPGETLYVVTAPTPSDAATPHTGGTGWMGQLWSSVRGADHPDGS